MKESSLLGKSQATAHNPFNCRSWNICCIRSSKRGAFNQLFITRTGWKKQRDSTLYRKPAMWEHCKTFWCATSHEAHRGPTFINSIAGQKGQSKNPLLSLRTHESWSVHQCPRKVQTYTSFTFARIDRIIRIGGSVAKSISHTVFW